MNFLWGEIMLAAGVVLTILALAAVRRSPAARRLRDGNDLSGMYLAAIAAVYGILLGFMVVAVWTRFDQAEAQTEEEAATLGTVVRLAHALPPGQGGDAVIESCRDYAEHVQKDEWPTMTRGHEDLLTHRSLDRLWGTVLHLQSSSRQDAPLVSEAIHQMTELSRLRRLRLLACQSSFPPLLWTALILGAILTMGASLLLWTDSFRLHALMACCLWLVIGLSLLAASELSTPFNGDVHVDSEAFSHAIPQLTE